MMSDQAILHFVPGFADCDRRNMQFSLSRPGTLQARGTNETEAVVLESPRFGGRVFALRANRRRSAAHEYPPVPLWPMKPSSSHSLEQYSPTSREASSVTRW